MDFLILLAHYGLPAIQATFAGIDQACSSVGVSPRPRRRAHVAADPFPPCEEKWRHAHGRLRTASHPAHKTEPTRACAEIVPR